MESREFKGKSVDEAIFIGLQAMGLSLDEVEIEVLQEGTKGFLGLGKNAIVRLTEREAVPIVVEPVPSPPPARRERRPERQERPPRAERPPRQRQPREDRAPREERPIREQPPLREAERPRPESEAPEAEEVVTIQSAEMHLVDTPEAIQAQEFLNGMFRAMGIEAACGPAEGPDPLNLHLSIEGKDTAVLIGRRGDTLDALQYLAGLVVNKAHEQYIRVMLDAEGYRDKRAQTLQKLARRLASNVARSGRPVKLEPMNPYERRILHATLQDHPKVETYSEGVDPYRRVIIRKKRGSGGPPRGQQDRRGPRPRRPRPQESE